MTRIEFRPCSRANRNNTQKFSNLERVKEGTGDKVGLFIQLVSQFISGLAIAFANDWKFALIMTAVAPLLMIAGALMSGVNFYLTVK